MNNAVPSGDVIINPRTRRRHRSRLAELAAAAEAKPDLVPTDERRPHTNPQIRSHEELDLARRIATALQHGDSIKVPAGVWTPDSRGGNYSLHWKPANALIGGLLVNRRFEAHDLEFWNAFRRDVEILSDAARDAITSDARLAVFRMNHTEAIIIGVNGSARTWICEVSGGKKGLYLKHAGSDETAWLNPDADKLNDPTWIQFANDSNEIAAGLDKLGVQRVTGASQAYANVTVSAVGISY